MSDDNRLNRLLTGLIRGAPPQPERMGAVLGKAVAIRRRRRAIAASGTAALAVVAVSAGVLLLGGEHQSAQDNLFADDPTPAVTTAPTPTTAPASSAAPEPSSVNTPRGTASPVAVGPEVLVAASSLLSTDYVQDAFGAGRPGANSTTTRALPGLIRSCLHLSQESSIPRAFVAKSWNWPGETVFSEALTREASETAAGDRYRTCTDPTARGFDPDAALYASDGGDPVTTEVDLMERGTGTVVVVPRGLDTSVYGAAVLDDVVLVLTWRQTGPVTSTDAFTRALVSAMRTATGGSAGTAVAAPAQQIPSELNGFLSRTDLPQPVPWVHDERANASALMCGQAQIPTTAPPVARRWEVTNTYEPGDDLRHVTIRFATSTDASTAATGFAACRQGWEARRSVDDAPADHPGDEAFVVSTGAVSQILVIRSGAAFLEVDVEYEDNYMAIARAALDALRAAGRLS
jgi:hypothetical protein